jgi:hypothetical protein
LAVLFLGGEGAEHLSRDVVCGEAMLLILGQTRSREKKEGVRDKIYPSKSYPQ